MSPLLWVLFSGLCAACSGTLVYVVMQSRVSVLLAKQREELAAAHATLVAEKHAMEESLRNAGETARTQAMNEFLADIRVEERHYTREHKILFLTKKSLVRQERIFFRNIPLSNWIEQEMPVEENMDVDKLAKTMSVFTGEAFFGPGLDRGLEQGDDIPRRLLR